MPHNDEQEAMVDACIEAGRLVMQHGSPRLQAVMRLLLFILGKELAE